LAHPKEICSGLEPYRFDSPAGDLNLELAVVDEKRRDVSFARLKERNLGFIATGKGRMCAFLKSMNCQTSAGGAAEFKK